MNNPHTRHRARTTIQDCAFLAATLAVSSLHYVSRLGFYSDDWTFLRIFHFSGQSLGALIQAFFDGNHDTRARPVQALYLAAQYKFFHLNPLGYNVLNTVVAIFGVCMFYLAVKAATENRLLALCLPLVYGLLPHYSTDRFWFAASQAALSMALYFLSAYCDLRQITSHNWAWKGAASLALIVSGLAYEVFIPLFLLTPVVVALKKPAGSHMRRIVLYLSNPVLLALLVVFKNRMSSRGGSLGWWIAKDAFTSAFDLNFGAYGIKLPHVLLTIARDYRNSPVFIVSILVTVGVAYYLTRIVKQTSARLPGAGALILTALSGIVVSGLSYAYFYGYFRVGTGINNRVAIAAAVGVAVCLVSFTGVFAHLTRRTGTFCTLIALVCGCGCLINNTIALFWIDAADQQARILEDIHRQLPAPPRGVSVMLEGFCPWTGPGIVFETDWDTTGALALLYRENTANGAVVRPWLKATEQGVPPKENEDPFPYTALYFYDVRAKQVQRIMDRASAVNALDESARSRDAACLANYAAFGNGLPVW